MTHPSLEERKALAERLRIKARMIELGEAIQFGSDSMVMEEAADLLDRLTDGELVATPPRVEADRETIARIIDPKAWRIRDEQYAAIDRLKLFPLDEAETKKAVDADIRDSLAKADAILAGRPTLSESGDYVLVPREPTVAQFEAAWGEGQIILKETGGALDRDQFIQIISRYYNAMISAAQPTTGGK